VPMTEAQYRCQAGNNVTIDPDSPTFVLIHDRAGFQAESGEIPREETTRMRAHPCVGPFLCGKTKLLGLMAYAPVITAAL
jgi:hypothetical protein